jgi:hypothetical protein
MDKENVGDKAGCTGGTILMTPGPRTVEVTGLVPSIKIAKEVE